MKTPSENIFKLIKSLNSQEKVYYKKSMQKNFGGKNYIEIFNIIHEMSKYDEQELKKRLKEKGITGDFKNLKSRTFDSVLSKTCDYHNESSFKRVVQDLIHKATILIEKDLFSEAEKTFKKAEKLAIKAKDYLLLIEISDLRISYYRREKKLDKIENYYNSGQFDVTLNYIEAIAEANHLNKKSIQLIILYLKGINNKSHNDKLKKVANEIFSKDEKHYKTHSSIAQYNNNHFLFNRVSNSFNEDSYDRQKSFIKYLEKEKELLKYRLSMYIREHTNYIVVQSFLGKINEMTETFEKMKKFYDSVPSKLKTDKTNLDFSNFFLNYIGFLVRINSFEKAIYYWEIQKGSILKYTLKDTDFIILHGNLAIIYFSVGDFHNALKHNNEITNLKSNQLIRIQTLFKLFLIMIHYELKNYELIPYLVTQGVYFMNKYKDKSIFFSEMFTFFKQMFPVNYTKKEITNAFNELLVKQNIIFKDSKEALILQDFDFISWTESKIQNRPFAEVVREKAGLMN